MTSTPVSLNDESLNGSWIDINSASQIHSPLGEDSPELIRPALSLAESVQNLGIISFQVERFLQEAQKSGANSSNTMSQSYSQQSQDGQQQQLLQQQQQQQQQQYPNIDNISDICLSDSDLSAAEELQSTKAVLDNLRRQHHARRHHQNHSSNITDNISQSLMDNQMSPDYQRTQRFSKSRDCLVDQLSDSLSILSRDSLFNEQCLRASASMNLDETGTVTDFDWLWDWTSQPEYFTGQEWKVSAPKQDYLLKQKQLYCASLASDNHPERYYSGDMMSLLFLTNILSIIIGAGLTYSILMRRSNI
jgi:hypothetical protein